MNGSGHRSLCVRRQQGHSRTLLNLKHKLPTPSPEDDYHQALCHGRGGATGGIQGPQKKPQLQCLCAFSDSKIFSLDFSLKTLETILNASLLHTLWAYSECWCSTGTTLGVAFALSLTLWSHIHLGMMNV